MTEQKDRGRAQRRRRMSREELQGQLVLPYRTLVLIKRDVTTEVSKLVYEHEVDILKEIFGDGAVVEIKEPLEHNIVIAPPDTIDAAQAEAKRLARAGRPVKSLFFHTERPMRQEPVNLDEPDGAQHWVYAPVFVGEEMQRLRTAYGKHHEKPEFYVDVVYPHEMDFIEACGGIWKEPSADAA